MEKSIARSVYRLMMRDEHRDGDVGRQAEVEEDRRQGDDHQHEDGDQPQQATMSLRQQIGQSRSAKNVCAPVAAIYRLVVLNE